MLLRNVEVQSEKITNRTIQRCSIAIVLALPANVNNYPLGLDLSKVNIKAILRRNKADTIVMQDNLDILARESMYFHSIEPLTTFTAYMEKTPYPNRSFYLPLFLDLGSVINLTGDDELNFEVNAVAGWYGTNTDASNCVLDFQWRDAIGVEDAIPVIRSRYIQGGATVVNEHLGDNVLSITYVNTHIQNFLSASAPINTLSIVSDKYQINDTYDRMIARRCTQFDSVEDANNRLNTFSYKPDTEIDDCRINITLNGANILQGKNAIVWRTYELDQYTYNRAINMDEKHKNRDANKLRKHFRMDGNRS